ncbi:MAG: transposase [Pseudomonadales bacterium RIFCSPHIGHO2_12_FULL_40_16]|jgi:putative transposase|nr:MAG: transposase [Pseudomonadales bacterium RIFCSPHIGHO2_12_FULL_40_16]
MVQADTVSIDRSRLIVKPNVIVNYEGQPYKIVNVLNANDVVITCLESARTLQVSIDTLALFEADSQQSKQLNKGDWDIPREAWQIALHRYEAIKPLIYHSTTELVEQRAEEYSINRSTLWKWLKDYRENNSILILVPKKRGWTNKKSRLSPQVTNIIKQGIQDEYLNAKKPSIAKTIEWIEAECKSRNIEPPHENSIRRRIEALNDYTVVKARHGSKAARDNYKAAAGSFPNADYPLAYVQIDHTPLDIEIVDDEFREAIGRPFLTLGIDVYSRMIVGYYLSLEAPSATSVAMCMASCILSKKRKLIELDIDADWEVEGLMDSVHTDNGSDFRTNHISKACLKYGINWEYRPIGGAQFGGHIERMLGIVNLQMHILDGTTFSNVKERGTYDSAKNACMTLKELEYYIVYWITKVYHRKKHSAIEMPPISKWDEGIWGTKTTAGTGLKERVADADTLFIDFLPEFESTIQRTGVQKDKLFYFADCLRQWINCIDPEDVNKKRKKKFLFKRDPRDISLIWFYEPFSNTYFKVPTAKREIPPLSLFEYKQVQKYLRSENCDTEDQDEIYKAILHLREQANQSRSLTRKQRRVNQRKKENAKATHHLSVKNEPEKPSIVENSVQPTNDLWSIPLTAFEDLRG